jgi:2-polyprenyl-3-methyl-5-hydroxy-6-metoxy-1,4-benzoquinol methylase
LLAEAEFRVLGIDPSPAMIEVANGQVTPSLNLQFQCGSPRSVELPNGCFDGIVCSSVIEYIPVPMDLLRWFFTLLKPTGSLIISFPNSASVWGILGRKLNWSPFQPAQKYVWRWTQFRSLLSDAGFEIVAAPAYFDSPFDHRPWIRGIGRTSLGGTLAMAVARPVARTSTR